MHRAKWMAAIAVLAGCYQSSEAPEAARETGATDAGARDAGAGDDMTMRWRTVDVPFATGAEAEPPSALLQPGAMTRVHNARMTRQGSWEAQTQAQRQVLGNETYELLSDGTGVFSRREATVQALATDGDETEIGKSMRGRFEYKPSVAGFEDEPPYTVFLDNGKTVLVNKDAFAYYNADGSLHLRQDQSLYWVFIVKSGSNEFRAYTVNTSGDLVATDVDWSGDVPSPTSSTLFMGLVDTSYDSSDLRIGFEHDGTYDYIAFKESGSDTVTVRQSERDSFFGSIVSRGGFSVTPDFIDCAINPGTGTLVVVTANESITTGNRAFTINSSFVSASSITSIGGTSPTDGMRVAASRSDADDDTATWARISTIAGISNLDEYDFDLNSVTTFHEISEPLLVSRLYSVVIAGDRYVIGAWQSADPLQPHLVLGWLTHVGEHGSDGTAEVREAAVPLQDLAASVNRGTGAFGISYEADKVGLSPPNEDDGNIPMGALLAGGKARPILWRLSPDEALPDASWGTQLMLGGDQVQALAAGSMGDAVPRFYPHTVSPSEGSANGTALADGTYSYSLVSAIKYADGRVARSAPSPAVQVTTTGGPREVDITFNLPQAPQGIDDSRQDHVVEVYRTQDAGTLFHHVMDVSWEADGSYSITDDSPDADIADNPILYTTGGILANEAPPAAYDMAVANGRVWVIPAQDRQAVWPSKYPDADSPPAWNASLVLRFEEDAGELTAIGSLQGRAIAFKHDTIYVVPGEGPDNAGSGGFGTPEAVSRGIGCTNPRSVIETDEGLWFAHHNRMYRLTPSLQVQPAGSGVGNLEDVDGNTLDLDEISGATFDSVARSSVWSFANTETLLVHNVLYGTWTTRDMAGDHAIGTVSHSSTTHDGTRLWHTTHDGSSDLFVEDASLTPATGQNVEQYTLVTPWYRFGSLQGYRRFRKVMFQAESVYDLERSTFTVEARYDSDSSAAWTQIGSWSDSTDHVERRGVRMPTQKVQSVQLRLTVPADWRMLGMAFELGGYPGLFRLPSSKRE